MPGTRLHLAACSLALLLAACSAGNSGQMTGGRTEPVPQPACEADNGGIQLPEGFCAVVMADDVGRVRHIVVDEQGDVYAALRNTEKGGGIAALRDTNGDGKADEVRYFGSLPGTGIGLRGSYLYFAPDTAVVRYRLAEGALLPTGAPEVIAGGLPSRGSHAAKPFTFDEAGGLYVNIGAPSNACQEDDRTPGSPAIDPCDILDWAGGIWRFDADRAGQQFERDGRRYATGIRNAVALDWNDETDKLYVAQHGRDMLSVLFPDLYTEQESAELPAEELFQVEEGDDFGWPYCYYDPQTGAKVLAPEYGGDGEEVGRCAQFENPVAAFPGHWAPNDLLFYEADAFPERYQGGAFIAFHGSWNRAPLPQGGYRVAFVPFDGTEPAGEYETFADGFKGVDVLENPSDARYRPMGLAVGPDGSLYIADSQRGRIWRVMWKG